MYTMARSYLILSFLLLFKIQFAFCKIDLFCSTIISPANLSTNSYFGVSVLLRNQGRVTVGAPRANSSLDRDIFQPGAVFDCHVGNAQCQEYELGPRGNYFMNDSEFKYGKIHHRKEDGWLGAALDGADSYDGELVVCSPRWINQFYTSELKHNIIFSMIGLCYFLKDSSNVSATAELLIPLRDGLHNYKQIHSTKTTVWHYGLGEAGMAVHLAQMQTPPSTEIMIGALGLTNWEGGLAKHIISAEHSENNFRVYNGTIKLKDFSYFGYSISSGEFVKGKRMYVSGAPRAELSGLVAVYEAQEVLLRRYLLRGQQLFEYFGAALAVGDVTGDGLDDLLVGAPTHSLLAGADAGRVYLYVSSGEEGKSLFKWVKDLRCPEQAGARFGTAVAFLGDINSDGYGDMAVGAPYFDGGKGSITLYYGQKNGLNNKFVTIPAETYSPELRGFGISISRGLDVDANNISDLAVGAYKSGHVVVLKTRPIVNVTAKLTSKENHFDISTKQLKIKCCLTISGKHLPESIKFERTVYFEDKRIAFDNNASYWREEKDIHLQKEDCVDLHINVQNKEPGNPRHLNIYMKYRMLSGESCNMPLPLLAQQTEPKLLVITYHLGCRTNVCQPGLGVQARWAENVTSLAVGRMGTVDLELLVTNSGEHAYDCWLRFSMPAFFSLVHPSLPRCPITPPLSQELCLIMANPFHAQGKIRLNFTFRVDLKKINYDEDNKVKLNVTSSGEEENKEDNVVTLELPLERDKMNFTNSSKSTPDSLVLNKGQTNSSQLEHLYKFTNKGYSPLDSFFLDVRVPIDVARENILKLVKLTLKLISEDGEFDISNDCEEISSVKNLVDGNIESEPKKVFSSGLSIDCFKKKKDLEISCREFKCSYRNRIYQEAMIVVNLTMEADIKKLESYLKDGTNSSLISTNVILRSATGEHKSGSCSSDIVWLQQGNLTLWLLVGLAISMLLLIILLFGLYKCDFFKSKYTRMRETQAELHHRKEDEDFNDSHEL